jgi:hypothetical protein
MISQERERERERDHGPWRGGSTYQQVASGDPFVGGEAPRWEGSKFSIPNSQGWKEQGGRKTEGRRKETTLLSWALPL